MFQFFWNTYQLFTNKFSSQKFTSNWIIFPVINLFFWPVEVLTRRNIKVQFTQLYAIKT
jgi:hypothetical protein